MAQNDLTVFLARQGDQVRFQGLPGTARAVVCYALDAPSLASPFAALDHAGITAIRDAIDRAIGAAERVTITCPQGTCLEGRADFPPGNTDTKTIRFPPVGPQPGACRGCSAASWHSAVSWWALAAPITRLMPVASTARCSFMSRATG